MPTPAALTFEEFVDREYARQVAFAFQLLRSHEDAEDAVQDPLVKVFHVWRRAHRYDAPASYLRLAVLHRCYSTTRHRSRLRDLDARAGNALSAAETSAPFDLDEVLRPLPRRRREVVVLRYVEDLALGEIARLLRISESSVKEHLARAKRTMRDRLTSTAEADGP